MSTPHKRAQAASDGRGSADQKINPTDRKTRRKAKPPPKKTAPTVHTAQQDKLEVTNEDVEWRYLL